MYFATIFKKFFIIFFHNFFFFKFERKEEREGEGKVREERRKIFAGLSANGTENDAISLPSRHTLSGNLLLLRFQATFHYCWKIPLILSPAPPAADSAPFQNLTPESSRHSHLLLCPGTPGVPRDHPWPHPSLQDLSLLQPQVHGL